MAAGAAQRRADLGVDAAEDVRRAAQELRNESQQLTDELDAALEDGEVTPEEVRRIVERARRVNDKAQETAQEADQNLVAAEWTDVGELQAIAKLTGRDSKNATIREMSVRQRAAEVGLCLTAV